jgi:ABC-type lipoprotein export system ATPase subunit/ABC-type lipoprotein release transport system permease subunit
LIVLKNIFKIFNNDNVKVKALDDINLDILDNGLIMILGASGSGKSTLLNILAFNESIDSGNYLLDEQNTKAYSPHHIVAVHRHIIAMVYQYYHLLKEHTVFDNIYIALAIKGYSIKKAKPLIEKYLKIFNLSHLCHHIVKTLSGGEAQRVAIIRALIINPSIILADEPTGAIDQKQATMIMEIFKQISINRIVIVVTHNKQLAYRYGDRIINLEQGKIISDQIINKTIPHHKNIENIHLKTNTSWRSILIKHNIKRHLFRHLTSGLSLIIGLSMSILTIGLALQTPRAIENELNKIGDRFTVNISKKQVSYLADSPFATVTRMRPIAHEMHAFNRYFNSFEQQVSLTGIFSNTVSVSNDDKEYNGISFLPIKTKDHFVDVKVVDENNFAQVSFTHVYINRQLAEIIDYNKPVIINFFHTYQYQSLVNGITPVSDTFDETYHFHVAAIIDEINIFNGPKIFYHYSLAKTQLQQLPLNNLSKSMNTPINWYQRILMGPDDHPITHYQRHIFLSNNDDLIKLKHIYNRMINNEGIAIEITSVYLQIDNLLNNLIKGLLNIIAIYIIIIFLGSLFIMGLISYTSFIEQKRDCALLINLGATKQDLYSIITKENIIASLLTSLISIVIAPVIIIIVNKVIYKYTNISSLISIPYTTLFNIPFFIPVLIVLFTLFITYFASMIPISSIKKISIAQLLKGE